MNLLKLFCVNICVGSKVGDYFYFKGSGIVTLPFEMFLSTYTSPDLYVKVLFKNKSSIVVTELLSVKFYLLHNYRFKYRDLGIFVI